MGEIFCINYWFTLKRVSIWSAFEIINHVKARPKQYLWTFIASGFKQPEVVLMSRKSTGSAVSDDIFQPQGGRRNTVEVRYLRKASSHTKHLRCAVWFEALYRLSVNYIKQCDKRNGKQHYSRYSHRGNHNFNDNHITLFRCPLQTPGRWFHHTVCI